jgi:hypothetical protein
MKRVTGVYRHLATKFNEANEGANIIKQKRTCRNPGSMLDISNDLNTTTFPSALGVCEADTELEGAVTGGTEPNGAADGDGEGVAAKQLRTMKPSTLHPGFGVTRY